MKIIIDLDDETKVIRSAQDEDGNPIDLARYAQCVGYTGETIYADYRNDGKPYSVTHRQAVSRGYVYDEAGSLKRQFKHEPGYKRNVHTVVCLSIKAEERK